jgi:hypothetical protein
MIAPPSGDDTLMVRQTYLRKRLAKRSRSRRRTVVWIVVGAVACWLCVAGLGVLMLGS